MDSRKIYIVIPACNEGDVVQDFIREIKNEGYDNIIVVDDGSRDDTYEKAKGIKGTIVLRHEINRGKGAATKTGIEAAKLMKADIIVTMDGDGQHDPKDIKELTGPIERDEKEVVLGSRLKNPDGMPFHKKIQNWIANILTWYLFGLWVSDSQSGFRAYSQKAARFINTRYDKYEYDSEVIRELYLHKLKFKEVPIKVRYTEYSKSKSEKQNILNGFKTLYKMLWKLIH
jgi:glycosyltransferase involved in cell wall biosynthesis